jgi:hypothetical protein
LDFTEEENNQIVQYRNFLESVIIETEEKTSVFREWLHYMQSDVKEKKSKE